MSEITLIGSCVLIFVIFCVFVNFILREDNKQNLPGASLKKPEQGLMDVQNPRGKNEFGGWLTLFNITLWFNFIVVILMSIGLLLSFSKISNSTSMFVNIITLIRYAITGFLMFQMITPVKKQEAIVPDKIVQLIIWYAAVYVIFVVLMWGLSLVDNTQLLIKLRTGFLIAGIPIIGWSLIWGQYFKVSKRVLAYYGKNAGG